MSKKFFITTPIYYPNGELHIGHTYTTTLADYINKYKKMQGFETMFVTGSDEHGQKIEDKAKEEGIDTFVFVSTMVENFKILWKKLNIDYDIFIRTTDSIHIKYVSNSFNELMNKGFIYKSKYTDLYCKSDEAYFTKTQAPEGICPVCSNKLEFLSEESYFLKISDFKSWVKNELLNSNLLRPKYRVNELINNFVDDLKDLSISRTSFSWGIKIDEDKSHVIYVWFDALQNYISVLNYPDSKFTIDEVWGKDSDIEIIQLIGKEITRFHCIYWPIILKMKNFRMPRILAHGWLVTESGDKMSKSKGNIVNPIKLIDTYGSDSLKFFLINNIIFGEDGKFSENLLVETINGILVNKYSNLIARTNSMIGKYFNFIVPKRESSTSESINLEKKLFEIKEKYFNSMDNYEFDKSTKFLINYIEELNGFIDITEPWKVKGDKLKLILNILVNEIFNVTLLLSSILSDSSLKVFDWLGINKKLTFKDLGTDFSDTKLNKIDYIFTRIEKEKNGK